MEKLYLVVRSDLKPGLQCAQACHAQHEFARLHPDLIQVWAGNLVVLQVENELALLALAGSLAGFSKALFREPDLNGETTAIAVEGAAGPALSSLPLALREAAA